MIFNYLDLNWYWIAQMTDDSMENAEEEVNEVTENPSTQANTGESSIQADTGESNTKVQIASKSKRKVMRPAYLKDFV